MIPRSAAWWRRHQRGLVIGALVSLLLFVALGPAGERSLSTCRVCGRGLLVYTGLGIPLSRVTGEKDPYVSWFDQHVHEPHEHDWAPPRSKVFGIPGILVVYSFLNPRYDLWKSRLCLLCGIADFSFTGPYSWAFHDALLAMPDQDTAVRFATRLARASPPQRVELFEATYWQWDKRCPAIDERLWKPLEQSWLNKDHPSQTFREDLNAWFDCHPEWK
jgi:hypothetical protein